MKKICLLLAFTVIFVSSVNADITFFARAEKDISTDSPVLIKFDGGTRYALIAISLPTPEANLRLATVKFLNVKLFAVSSNSCTAYIKENTVTFQCLSQLAGDLGTIVMEYKGEGPENYYSYTLNPPSLVYKMSVSKLLKGTVELPLGSSCRIDTSNPIWYQTTDYKIIRSGNTIQVLNRPGDVNLDGVVNILDMVLISKIFGAEINPESPEDLNWDGTISRDDLNVLTTLFGTKYNSPPSAPPKLASGQTPITWATIKKQ